jgi:hypothetical protein
MIGPNPKTTGEGTDMDLEKIAESSHQAWFVAMAKQGWIFGPRLNPDFKTHPWLKPYSGLADNVKEIVRAQVRGTLAALETHGVPVGTAVSAPTRPAAPAQPAVTPRPQPPAAQPVTPPPAAATPAAQPAARPAPPQPAAVSAPQASSTPAAGQDSARGQDMEVLERKVDSSGRMRIGSGLVKKAELLPEGATQVGIVSKGSVIEVMPNAEAPADAFFAAVNPDGFMLPKAILAATGTAEFTIHIQHGRLILRPKA